MHNLPRQKSRSKHFYHEKGNSTVLKKERRKNQERWPRGSLLEKCYSRLPPLASRNAFTWGGHWSAESRLDLLAEHWGRGSSSLSLYEAIIRRGGREERRASPIAKTLKGLKTTNSGRDTRGRARSWVIIYEFGAPKKAAPKEIRWPGHRPRYEERRSTDFKSIRKPDKIFYGERALMALTTKGPPWPHWFVVTEDDRPYRLAPCPSSADPFPQRDCDIASVKLARISEFQPLAESRYRGPVYNALTRLKYFFHLLYYFVSQLYIYVQF